MNAPTPRPGRGVPPHKLGAQKPRIQDARAEATAAPTAPRQEAPRRRIGIADTTFARIDMGAAAEDQIRASAWADTVEIVRVTVPGFKDLAVACKKLVDEERCDIVVACGQVGTAPIDKQCAHEASLGLQWARLLTNAHILEVFVHADEVPLGADAKLRWLGERRAREHADNALALLFEPGRLRKSAGTGQRQGFADEGPIS